MFLSVSEIDALNSPAFKGSTSKVASAKLNHIRSFESFQVAKRGDEAEVDDTEEQNESIRLVGVMAMVQQLSGRAEDHSDI
jgi:hypothetical protein